MVLICGLLHSSTHGLWVLVLFQISLTSSAAVSLCFLTCTFNKHSYQITLCAAAHGSIFVGEDRVEGSVALLSCSPPPWVHELTAELASARRHA